MIDWNRRLHCMDGFLFVGAMPMARPHLEHINTDQGLIACTFIVRVSISLIWRVVLQFMLISQRYLIYSKSLQVFKNKRTIIPANWSIFATDSYVAHTLRTSYNMKRKRISAQYLFTRFSCPGMQCSWSRFHAVFPRKKTTRAKTEHIYIYWNIYRCPKTMIDWNRRLHCMDGFLFVGAMPMARPHLEHINTDQGLIACTFIVLVSISLIWRVVLQFMLISKKDLIYSKSLQVFKRTKELPFQLIGQYLQLTPMWHTHLEHHTVWKENVFQLNVSSLDSAALACDVAEADSMSRFLGKNNKIKNKTRLYKSKDYDWLKKIDGSLLLGPCLWQDNT